MAPYFPSMSSQASIETLHPVESSSLFQKKLMNRLHFGIAQDNVVVLNNSEVLIPAEKLSENSNPKLIL